MPVRDTRLELTAELDGRGWTVLVATSRHLRTNVTVVRRGDEALVVDAPYRPGELAALARLVASRRPAAVRLFATHSHYDHLMGRLAFPGAPLLAGEDTVAAVRRGLQDPARELREADAANGVRRGEPLDPEPMKPVTVPGTLCVGDGEVHLLRAPGHTRDGAALWAPWAGVLCCGDYLSDVELPLLSAAGSLAAYRETLSRLAALLGDAVLVVPGHGSPAPPDVAARRLAEDLEYLGTVEGGDPGPRLPSGRDDDGARRLHAANLARHGPLALRGDGGGPRREVAEDPAA